MWIELQGRNDVQRADGVVEKPRRRCSKIAHETHAFYDGDEGISVAGMAEIGRSFTIRHYTTDIVRIHPECVELLSVFPSQVTRDRINNLLPKPWRVWSDTGSCNSVLAYCENVGELSRHVDCYAYFVIPAERGLRTDFKPTARDVYLSLGCRIGDVEAADKLAASLSARGYKRMAEVVRQYRGRRFYCKGQIRHLQTLYAGTEAYVEKTVRYSEIPNPDYDSSCEWDTPTLSKREDVVTLPEAWLFDPATGEPVRMLTTRDVCFYGVDPKAKLITLDGRTYEVARERLFERFGSWKNRFAEVRSAVVAA